MDVEYYIDGHNFKDFGVHVSDSKGVVDKPKRKKLTTVSWEDYNGNVVDLRKVRYESRDIDLVCFMEASGRSDFLTKVGSFVNLLDKPGTQRLHIEAVDGKPLVYEVYCEDQIKITKKWNDDLMVGTFTIPLIEPDPVKRVIKGNGVTNISMKCNSMLTVFWGNGERTDNLSGNISISNNTTGYVIIAGNIDEITDFSTNGILIWNKLM